MPSFPTNEPQGARHRLFRHMNASMRRLRLHASESTSPPPLPETKAKEANTVPSRWRNRSASVDLLRSTQDAAPLRHANSSSESFFCCQTPSSGPSPEPSARAASSQSGERARGASPHDGSGRGPRRGQAAGRTMPSIDTLRSVPSQWQRNEPLHLDVYHPHSQQSSPVAPLDRRSPPFGAYASRLSPDPALAHVPLSLLRELRALMQRTLLRDLGLYYERQPARGREVSHEQWLATDVLLAASWRAFVEARCPPLLRGHAASKEKEQATREAHQELLILGETYGLKQTESRELALYARDQWAQWSRKRQSLTSERLEPYQQANVRASSVHSVEETKNALVRIHLSHPFLGPLRVRYLVGTALHLGEPLRSIGNVAEATLASPDADFEAVLTHVWRSPKTDHALGLYRAQRLLSSDYESRAS